MKKIISMALCVAMAMSVPVLAEQSAVQTTEQKSYAEELAKKAEKLFNITDNEYTYSYTKDNEKYSYMLNWANYEVAFSSKGNVISCYYLGARDNKGSATENEIRNEAQKYLDTLLGENADKMRITAVENDRILDNGWNVRAYEYIGDYKVEYNSVSFSFSNEGKLLSYTSSDNFDKEVSQSNYVMPYEEAKEKYIEATGFDKMYKKSYGYTSDKKEIYGLFSTNSSYNMSISASNGQIVNVEDSGYADEIATTYAMGVEADNKSNILSEAELETLKKRNEAITLDKACEVANNLLNTKFDKNDTEISYYYGDNKEYNVSIYSEAVGQVSMDSKGKINGIVVSYNDDKESNPLDLTKDKSDTKIQEFLKKLGYEGYVPTYTNNDNAVEYSKKENGYINMADSITFSAYDDYSSLYFYTEKSNLPLPEMNTELDASTAFDKCNEAFHFMPSYKWDSRAKKGVLVYSFNTQPFLSLEGKALTPSGEEYVAKDFGYEDIENVPQKDIILELKKMGYKFNSTKFQPDKIMTYEDAKEFCVSLYYNYGRKIGFKDNRELTKYDVAKIFTYILDYDILCKDSNAFVKPYNDLTQDNIPFVAICSAMGIFEPTEAFEGENKVTRAEFAQNLYNYTLAVKSMNGEGDLQ